MEISATLWAHVAWEGLYFFYKAGVSGGGGEDDDDGCRAEKIVNDVDEPHTESSQELQQLMDCRVKCCNNLAAAQMKVESVIEFALSKCWL